MNSVDFTAYLPRFQYCRPCMHDDGYFCFEHMPPPLTLEHYRSCWNRLKELAQNPPPPEPLVVSKAEFARLRTEGKIDAQGNFVGSARYAVVPLGLSDVLRQIEEEEAP